METRTTRIQTPNDKFRRQLVGGLGIITLEIAALGLGGIGRGVTRTAVVDKVCNDTDAGQCPREIDVDGEHTLYEIAYYAGAGAATYPLYPVPSSSAPSRPPRSTTKDLAATSVTDADNARDRFLRDSPGSPQALKRGCTCFPAENQFGSGRRETEAKHPIFVVDTECPLHGVNALLDLLDYE